MSTLNNANLQLNNITVNSDKKKILADFSVTFPVGQITTIIGASGVGKTTLLNVVAGLRDFASGTMTLNGQPFIPKEHVMALVPQDYGLLPWETATQAVINALKITKQPINQTVITQLFEKLSIMDLKTKYPHEMSGGQQQRVSLARGFAVAADVLLMDEPFSALDTNTREQIQTLFMDTWQMKPGTTLFITHDIQEAILLGQQILVLTPTGAEMITHPEQEADLVARLKAVIGNG
ncbi:ATP-binding cassette domain-containing protein [Periweissella cryptocerci]|uniref:ATP-binding cassette domain-containing protein n=1 Tax=Periweissella cryptocerci TaxID=2506420 RepID=A0A4P6YRL5_9LACO|nr:ATP-binding cassette domain-containing protein [Periweissella cryptocerci]QBO35261.1 ATP-binding cassette domain-containing protein [Periweissella cryptocerci]